VRKLLIVLWQDYRAPKLYERIIKPSTPKPRNVTATEAERVKIMSMASPHLLCMIMLCSDMAIRSGTAQLLTPEKYDSTAKTLTYDTKYQNRQCLPVPAALALLLDKCGRPDVPFVAQLEREDSQWGKYFKYDRALSHQQLYLDWKRLKARAGITRKLTYHDLRRTTAFRIYGATKDIRLVQAVLGHSNLTSTCWYLDHHLTEVPVAVFEQARLNQDSMEQHEAKFHKGTETIQ
jgi:integrase